MRILVLLTDLFDAVGGIQTFNRVLVKALDEIGGERGWKFTVLVLNDNGDSNLLGRYINPAKASYKGFGRNRVQFATRAIKEGWKSDWVFFGHVHFVPLAIAMNNSVKFLVVHGVDVWKRLPVLQRLGLNRVKLILTVSNFTQEQMVKYNHVPLRRFDLLPNTLDPYFANGSDPETRRDLGLPAGRMILSVARLNSLERCKGIDKIIEAMPSVLKKIPDAFLTVVGHGADRPRLERIAKEVGVNDKVIFAGRVADNLLPSYYQACEIFVLPSLLEGFGIVFLEAMYYAKPCVGARAGGIPEVIEDGKTGFLTEPGDTKSLADYIVRLLSDGTLRQAMGEAGKDRLMREFSFTHFNKKLENVLWGLSKKPLV